MNIRLNCKVFQDNKTTVQKIFQGVLEMLLHKLKRNENYYLIYRAFAEKKTGKKRSRSNIS